MGKSARILLVTVLALALGACGSSYKGLSKADFVKQAEAICTAGQKKLDAVSAQFGNKEPSLAQLQDVYAKQFTPAIKDELTALRALKPPKADRATVSKMFDDLSTGIDQATTEIASAKSLAAIGKLQTPAGLKSANAEAKAYGLPKCGAAN